MSDENGKKQYVRIPVTILQVFLVCLLAVFGWMIRDIYARIEVQSTIISEVRQQQAVMVVQYTEINKQLSEIKTLVLAHITAEPATKKAP
jgi:hypothetical protein